MEWETVLNPRLVEPRTDEALLYYIYCSMYHQPIRAALYCRCHQKKAKFFFMIILRHPGVTALKSE
jgi:hypothetical protein